jgi:hypothetical protein
MPKGDGRQFFIKGGLADGTYQLTDMSILLAVPGSPVAQGTKGDKGDPGPAGGNVTIDDTTPGTGKVFSSAKVAAGYVSWDGTNLKQNGATIPAGSGSGSVTFGTDANGFDTITTSAAAFGTDARGFDTITI